MQTIIRFCILTSLLIGTLPHIIAQPAPPPSGGKVTGRIVDADGGSPLEFATVSIYTSDSVLVTGAITNGDGTFSIDVKSGDYYAVIQFISYNDHNVDGISVNVKERVYDIGTVSLESKNTALDEVTVVGEKSEMVLSLDKKIFNVGKDLSNTGKSALDILDNIPSVTVDLDGNVSLRGSESIQILVDGKPSGLVTAGNTEALRSLQGSMIERVEVITNPSARYEAEGMAGIINIVLKKDQQKGVNGSFEGTIGYPQEYSFGANVNFRREKINYFLNYNIRYHERPGSGSSSQYFTLSDTSYITERENDRLRTGITNRLRGGADLYLNPNNILTLSFLVSYEDQLNTTNVWYSDYTSNRDLLLQTHRIDTEKEDEKNFEFALNYDKQFSNKDHKLTAVVQYLEDTETEDSDIGETIAEASGEIIESDDIVQKVLNVESEKNFLVQADYVNPFGNDGKFEAGYRSEFRTITNPYTVEEKDENGNWTQLPEFTNDFDYTENVYAMYTQAGEKFGAFSLQLGLRAEYSDVRTYLHETDERNNRTYLDLFPTVHTTFEFNKLHAIQLSYSRRINRPHFWLLNPFYSFSDPRNIRTGNPNLDPEYTHSGEAGYLFRKEGYDFYSGIYYRYTTGVIERVNQIDDSTGITFVIPFNLAQRQSYGLELNATARPAKWLTLSANANFYRSITEGEFDGESLNSDDYSWDLRGNARLRLPKNTDFQTIFFYRAPQQTTQGRRQSMYMLNMALSKDILKGKGTLTFNVRDVLNSRKWRFILDQPQLYSTNEFQWSERTYTLTFIYRLNQKKQMGRQGGSGGGDFDGGDSMGF